MAPSPDGRRRTEATIHRVYGPAGIGRQELFLVGFTVAIDGFKRSLNPKNIRMISGRAQLAAPKTTPGAEVCGE